MEKPSDLRPGFVDPFEDRALLRYFTRVREWHGYLRFIGLTAIWDTPDLAIEKLFVAPRLSERPISPQADEASLKDTQECYAYLRDHPRLVMLGDPGSGKSTLVSWLATRLTVQKDDGLVAAVGRLIPFPLVLRELELAEVKTWDDLWAAFLKHNVAEPLLAINSVSLLESGQAFVFLDGIDEISDREVRRRLRDAVQEGIRRFPGARWLLTSRVLGYEEVPFELLGSRESMRWLQSNALSDGMGSVELDRLLQGYEQEPQTNSKSEDKGKTDLWARYIDDLAPEDRDGAPVHQLKHFINELVIGDLTSVALKVAYVAPFNDEQITRFATHWYAIRDSRAGADRQGATEFINAIHRAEDTSALARTPNLLTMMVLVHRNRTTLPHGKAYLYEEITKAYLGGIDAFRKLDSMEEFTYTEKREWLAQIGLFLQRRRTEASASVLVEREKVKELLETAIRGKYGDESVAIAERFLDFVARRSGLLIPRTETQFAFVHLSFQEFFAATALRSIVTARSWYLKKYREVKPKQLRAWASQSIWTETILFLFQLLREENEPDPDLKDVFVGGLKKHLKDFPLQMLAARLALNRYSALTDSQRKEIFLVSWRANEAQHQWDSEYGQLGRTLIEGDRASLARSALGALLEEFPATKVVIKGVSQEDCFDLFQLKAIRSLDLSTCFIADLSPLSGLTSLETLSVSGTQVSDLSPLSGLASLKTLDVSGSPVSDLSPLSGLACLETLYAWRTQVSDLSPLSGLASLKTLYVSVSPVSDLFPLSGLSSLETLNVSGSPVSDLSPLSGLASLKELYVSGTQVSDLSPLSGLASLGWLDVSGTPVSDLSPLSGLASLGWLNVSGTPVSDLSPLSGLAALGSLYVSGTQVVDFGPVETVARLQIIGRPDSS